MDASALAGWVRRAFGGRPNRPKPPFEARAQAWDAEAWDAWRRAASCLGARRELVLETRRGVSGSSARVEAAALDEHVS